MANPHDLGAANWVEERLAALTPDPTWEPDGDAALRKLTAMQRARAGRAHHRLWTLGAAALVIVAAFVAVPATRVLAERCVDACVGGVGRVGQLLRISPRATVKVGTPSLVGTVAPDFTRRESAGGDVTLSALRGHVVLLNFWATWCPPCKTEIPWFADFQTRYASQGLIVVGVSLDEDGWTAVTPFLREANVNYRIVLGDDRLFKRYGDVGNIPATFIIDRTGRVASQHVGLVTREEYDRDLLSALGGN